MGRYDPYGDRFAQPHRDLGSYFPQRGKWKFPDGSDERRCVMDALMKLETLAGRYDAHQRRCRGFAGIDVTADSDAMTMTIDVTCSRCASGLTDTFAPGEVVQLHDAGIATDVDVRRIVDRIAQQAGP
jgi:hypothetical protein